MTMSRREREAGGVIAVALLLIAAVIAGNQLIQLNRVDNVQRQACERVRAERHRINVAFLGQWKFETAAARRLEATGRHQLVRGRRLLRSSSRTERQAGHHVLTDARLNLSIAKDARGAAQLLTYSTQTNCRDAEDHPESYEVPRQAHFPLPKGVPLP